MRFDNLAGIPWMILNAFFAAVMVSIVRVLQNDVSVFQMIFFRGLFGTIFFLPWIAHVGVAHLRTNRPGMHLFRAVIGITGMCLWFYALTQVSLSVASALSFLWPLFSAVMAVFIYRERVVTHRWIAMAIGLAGVLIVVRPGADIFDPHALIVPVAVFFWAMTSMILRPLTRDEDFMVVVFYFTLLFAVLMFPLALLDWRPVPWKAVPWLVALGLASNIVQIALSRAIRRSEFAAVLPFYFTNLIFVAAIAYFAFDEITDIWTIVGGAVIMAGSMYAAWRESRREKKRIRRAERRARR